MFYFCVKFFKGYLFKVLFSCYYWFYLKVVMKYMFCSFDSNVEFIQFIYFNFYCFECLMFLVFQILWCIYIVKYYYMYSKFVFNKFIIIMKFEFYFFKLLIYYKFNGNNIQLWVKRIKIVLFGILFYECFVVLYCY